MADKSSLSEYDFIIAIDASGSMSEEDCPRGMSRWNYAQETITALARDLEKLDSDGIDVLFFSGATIQGYQGVKSQAVKDIFSSRSPRGSTPLAEALTACLEDAHKSDKKDFILVLTDGVPDDKAAVAKVIRDASQTLESDDELTFLFVQVGHDAAATEYLRMLDDDLKGAKFDIVDVKTVEEAEAFATIEELLLAAIDG
jgi:Mg-chelatase subunit ChlD